MTFKDIFKSDFLAQVAAFSLVDMLVALALALAIGLFICEVYRKTYRGVMYSRSFGVTGIRTDDIKASYENGVLKLFLPKSTPAAPVSKRLEID